MEVRLFRLYGASECRRIAQRTMESLAEWSQDWLPSAGLSATFRNVAGPQDPILSELDAESQLMISGRCESLLVVMMRGAPAGLLQLLPVTGGVRGADAELERSLQNEVAVRCARDLSNYFSSQAQAQKTADGPSVPVETVRVAAAALPAPGKGTEAAATGLIKVEKKTLAPLLQPGSGWGVLTLSCDAHQLKVLLGPGYLLQLLDSNYPPRPRGGLAQGVSALGDRRIVLAAELGNTTLTIGDLENLRVGDVIRLDQSCDARVQLRVVNGVYLAEGRLGRMAESKAMQLLSTDSK